MTDRFIKDWAKTKRRFEAYWANSFTDRCLISVTAPKDGKAFYTETPPDSYEALKHYWTDAESVLQRNIKTFESTYFAGDAIPVMPVDLGPGSAAAFFGSNIHFAPNTVWFEPCIDSMETARLRFEPDHWYWKKTKELSTYFAQQSNGDFFVAMSDITSAADILSLLRGTENLCMDFYDYPEETAQAIDLIADVCNEVNREMFRLTGNANEGGSCIHWLQTWAPGAHAQLQCDLSAVLSTPMFEEYVAGSMRREMTWQQYPLYHLDGPECIHHLDSLLALNDLKVIEWIPGTNKPVTTSYLPMLKKIQQAGKGLHLLVEPWEVEALLGELSANGLYIKTTTDTPEQADALVKIAERCSKA